MLVNPPETAPDLSIVLDLETIKITGNILADHQVALWLDAAREITPKTFELIICTRQEGPLRRDNISPEVKVIHGAGKGYYALKNEGGAAATGEIIFFTDVDCRPSPGYLVRLLAFVESNHADIVGGRSFYDGDDFATRVCTVVSFGRLHGVDQVQPHDWYLAHNVAVRRGVFPELFGAFTGRYGGDEFLTSTARGLGLRLPVPQDLILFHESAAHSWRGLLDRHLREIVRTAFLRHGAATRPWDVVKEAGKTGRQRWLAFKRRESRFTFSRGERERARWLFKAYQILDIFVSLGFLLRPSLLARWITYQFGESADYRSVSQTSPQLTPPSTLPFEASP